MSQIIKAFFGVFMILFMALTATGILSAYMQVAGAQDLHASMVDEIENSNFYPEVMRDCFALAEKSGYQLQITLFYEDYGQQLCDSSEMVPEDTAEVVSARVDMTFLFSVPFFGVRQPHTFCAYAR